MRRTPWSRAFAALFALWFAALVGDPGTLHSCAMHGGAAGHSAHHAAAAHEGHAAHHEHHAAAPHDSPQPAQHGPCTCIGHCCAVTAAVPLPTVATLVVPVAVAQQRHPIESPRLMPPAAPDLRLPFANGPPTV